MTSPPYASRPVSPPGVAPFSRSPAASALKSRGDGADTRLREVSAGLEAVFLEHLFRAMRATVPRGGPLDGGLGEDVFTGMMDEYLADRAAARIRRGLGDAIYRQLAGAARGSRP